MYALIDAMLYCYSRVVLATDEHMKEYYLSGYTFLRAGIAGMLDDSDILYPWMFISDSGETLEIDDRRVD
jgi:hypothetical protein